MNILSTAYNCVPSQQMLTGLIKEAVSLVASIDPSVTKVVTGASLTLTGSVLVARSQILDRPIAYLRGQEKDTSNKDTSNNVNYKVAAVGGVTLGTGLTLMTMGVTELYYRYTNNLCNYRSDTLCKGNLGIPREQMPQLDKNVKPKFLGTYGDNVTYKVIDANDLHATQKEINFQKVNGMVESAILGQWSPCNAEIITANGLDGNIMIVDGHHRAAACFEIGGQIPVAHVNSDIRQVLDYANQFEGVEQHSFNQVSKI